jgi:hypothetical protein
LRKRKERKIFEERKVCERVGEFWGIVGGIVGEIVGGYTMEKRPAHSK